MGFYFNTPQTIELISILNSKFGKANIANIRNNYMDRFTGQFSGSKLFPAVAIALKIYPGGNTTNPSAVRWLTKYLPKLHTKDQPGTSAKITQLMRNYIYNGLRDNGANGSRTCEEIVFVAIPSEEVSVSATEVPAAGEVYTLVITLHTKTVDALMKEQRSSKKKKKG